MLKTAKNISTSQANACLAAAMAFYFNYRIRQE
jgi:hypothetical protein